MAHPGTTNPELMTDNPNPQLTNPQLKKVAVAVLLLLGVGLIGYFLTRTNADTYYGRLDALYQEFKVQSEWKSQEQWDTFKKHAEEERQAIIKALASDKVSHSRDVNGKACRELLFAARDHFGKMLDDKNTTPNETEAMFKEHLEAARLILDGKPIPQKAPPGSQGDDPEDLQDPGELGAQLPIE